MMVTSCKPMNESTNAKKILVLMSDFGLSERFVASMKGVVVSVDENIKIYDLTHSIEPYNIWEASQTLAGTIKYWPEGTVFVSVVDPGVGTDRKSVVLKTNSGHFVVTPDNGTLTFVAEQYGVVELREIDESINRLPGSDDSHTFHGRDVYAYTGGRLAAGVISFSEVGPKSEHEVVRLSYQTANKVDDSTIVGTIMKIEKPFGNIVTNIPRALFDDFGIDFGLNAVIRVQIIEKEKTLFEQELPYVKSFGYVESGEPLLYQDSMQMLGLAINGGSFAKNYSISAGAGWTIKLEKVIQ